MSTFIACAVRRLGPWEQIAAARTAILHNPANAPNVNALARSGAVIEPARLALLTSKYWGAQGVRLSVQFLDTGDSALQNRILSHMNAWGERANVQFLLTHGSGQVRIARTPGHGHYSYLGTDVLRAQPGQPTMNLDSFSHDTPDSEFYRVVRHETGHTLGFPHEHMRREIVARLDHGRTVAYFGATQGWDPQTVQQQVLTVLEDAELRLAGHPELSPAPADQDSIMCYQLPGEITVDGRPITGGTDINDSDFGLASRAYPKAGTPTPTPTPAGGWTVTLRGTGSRPAVVQS